jgi:hypothetical protein
LPGYDFTSPECSGNCPSCNGSCAFNPGGIIYGANNLLQGLSTVTCPVDSAASSDYSNNIGTRNTAKNRQRRTPERRTRAQKRPDAEIVIEKETDIERILRTETTKTIETAEPPKAQPRTKLPKAEEVSCPSRCENCLLVTGEGLESALNGTYEISLFDYTILRGSCLDHHANTSDVHILESGTYRIAYSGRFIAENPDSTESVRSQIELRDQRHKTLRTLRALSFIGEPTRDEFSVDLKKGDSITLVWQLEHANQTIGIAEPVVFIEKIR